MECVENCFLMLNTNDIETMVPDLVAATGIYFFAPAPITQNCLGAGFTALILGRACDDRCVMVLIEFAHLIVVAAPFVKSDKKVAPFGHKHLQYRETT